MNVVHLNAVVISTLYKQLSYFVHAVSFVPYKLTVSAENGAGVGLSKEMTLFTAQGGK